MNSTGIQQNEGDEEEDGDIVFQVLIICRTTKAFYTSIRLSNMIMPIFWLNYCRKIGNWLGPWMGMEGRHYILLHSEGIQNVRNY